MTPRRMIRWKSFWLGVVVLLFLGWGWMSTVTRWQSSSCVVGKNRYFVSSYEGAVAAGWSPHVPQTLVMEPTVLSFEGFVGYGSPVQASVEEMPPRYFAPALYLDWDYWTVGYWVLVLGFLVGWAGLLVWRWRRLREVVDVGAE